MRLFGRLIRLSFVAGVAAAAAACGSVESNLRANAPVQERLDASKLTLAPLQFVSFCMRNGAECAPKGPAQAVVALDSQVLAVLEGVNRAVNARIAPSREEGQWRINPSSGNCNDYVVSKRHELLARGMPSSALLINVVRTPAGEGHLVLVVRTDRGALVLDNLTSDIRAVGEAPYSWIKRQTIRDPNLWEMA